MQSFKKIDVSAKKLILVAITGMTILMFSDIPYFNLIANTQVLLFAIWLMAVIIFGFDSKTVLISSFTVLLYSLILMLLGQDKEAQLWGDWSFPILVIALTKYFLENRKEIQSS